jgi:fructoselysine-6-P-deglycase FrlB-like protein
LFSETMRDLDLVVSVAHRGGIDPEASASTLEMRATLVKETCGLHAEAFSSAEVKHGPMALVGEGFPDMSLSDGSTI